MRVPDEVIKAVGFVSFLHQKSKELAPVGSFFYLGHEPKQPGGPSPRVYAVTARHVIDGLRSKGVAETYLRLNTPSEKTPLGGVHVPIGSWFVHPSDSSIDVAICEGGVPDKADHRVIPMSFCLSEKIYVEHEVGLGDEVFVIGLFRHHYGRRKNIPIVRVGNLASDNAEPVQTRGHAPMNAFLIEARSIGGLSGSPVFLNLGNVRAVGGALRSYKEPVLFLAGLIHGHFDVAANPVTPVGGELTDGSINSGIAIVSPIQSVLAVIDAFEKAHPR